MHMLHLLEEDGTLGVILPSGVLCASTPGVIEFRKFLVENKYIDTIIQLPLNIFPYVSETTITYILIIQKCVENQKHQIRFIDASEMHERIKSGISLRQLGKKNIKDIMEMVSQNKKNDKMSIANIEQIRKNNYVLTTNLYCSNHLQENKEVNIKNIAIFKREIELLETKKNNLSQKIQQIEKEIELFFENSKERKEIAIKDIIQEITKTNKDSFPYDICSLDCKKGLILRDNNKQFKKNIKNYRIAYPNNIVMNNRDFLKHKSIAYNIYNKPVLISNIYSVFEVKEGFDANFILNFLKNSQVHKKLKVIGKQGVISEIDKNVFYQLTFKLPALKEQKQINVFFNNLSKLLNDIENISIEIRQLQKEKQEYYYLL